MKMLILALAAVVLPARTMAATPAQREALSLIKDEANSICATIPMDSDRTHLELSAGARVGLKGFAKKLGELDAHALANYERLTTNGVLQKDLALALSDQNKCKLKVFEILEKDLLHNQRVIIPPAPTQAVNIRFPSTTDITTENLIADSYLEMQGIHLTKYPNESKVVFTDSKHLYNNRGVREEGTLLTQQLAGENDIGVITFTLSFSKPTNSVRITRATLWADTKSGVTHPSWTAYALDKNGEMIVSQGEDLIRSFDVVPEKTFALKATATRPIYAVRFASDWRLDGAPFAGTRALLIKSLVLNY